MRKGNEDEETAVPVAVNALRSQLPSVRGKGPAIAQTDTAGIKASSRITA